MKQQPLPLAEQPLPSPTQNASPGNLSDWSDGPPPSEGLWNASTQGYRESFRFYSLGKKWSKVYEWQEVCGLSEAQLRALPATDPVTQTKIWFRGLAAQPQVDNYGYTFQQTPEG